MKEITIHLDTIKGTNTDGQLGICVLTDVNATTPTASSSCLSQAFAKFGKVGVNQSLRFKPPLKKWLFTRDTAASTEDRLEMFGDIIIWSENCTSSFIPATPWIDYDVEFKTVSNETVQPVNKPSKLDNNNNNDDSSDEDPIVELIDKKVVPAPFQFPIEKIPILTTPPMADEAYASCIQLITSNQIKLVKPQINVVSMGQCRFMPFPKEMNMVMSSTLVHSMATDNIIVSCYIPPCIPRDYLYLELIKTLEACFVPYLLTI